LIQHRVSFISGKKVPLAILSNVGRPASLFSNKMLTRRGLFLDSLLILFFSARLFIFGAYQALTQLGGQFVLSL
jgi:hypothetical protein